jgi:membrane protein
METRGTTEPIDPIDPTDAAPEPDLPCKIPGSRRHSLSGVDPAALRIWESVSRRPLGNLWRFRGVAAKQVWSRTFHAFLNDELLSRAAELGYYFLFALFPMLVCASAMLGLAARSASQIYVHLLQYLALVVPASAYNIVIETFNQTAAAATGGKITLGLVASLWSASVGFAAIQEGMNTVYKVRESRPFWKARGSAILVTMALSVLVTLNLAVLLLGDFLAAIVRLHIWHHWLALTVVVVLRIAAWTFASVLLMVQLDLIYYFAPDMKAKRWRWMTPGAAIALLGWLAASVGLKVYLHLFNSFTITYGSLGAVIVLLTWFYITGLMILLGAEINSEIQGAVAEKNLKQAGEISAEISAEPDMPPV